MTRPRTPVVAALLLQSSVWAADEAQAEWLRKKAERAGAALAALAEAVRLREERVAEDVTVIGVDE